jgi:hypothetical protein
MNRNALTLRIALVCMLTGAVAAEASTQHGHCKGAETLKKLLVILLAGCVFVLSQGVREVAAEQGYTPLEELAGTYALTAQGSIALCLKPTPPFPLVHCGSTGSIVVPLSVVEVGVITSDAAGNACATITETLTDLPVDAFPPAVFVIHVVSKTTSYDPTTGTGDKSDTGYSGGQCQGSTFDSTGATVGSSGTEHFAVSNKGKQIDAIVTSLTNPDGSIGGFSISVTQLRE